MPAQLIAGMNSILPITAARASLLFGLLCTPVGLAIGGYIAATAIGTGYGSFVVGAPLAAFATSAILWRVVVERPWPGVLERRRRAAALTGVLSGALSHWLCWYLLLLWANAGYWLAGAPDSSLREPPVDPVTALAAALVLSAWSLVFFGPITIPAGAVLGLVWHSWLARRVRHSPTSPSSPTSR